MSKKSEPLKVVIMNPLSEEQARQIIERINNKFKLLYSENKDNLKKEIVEEMYE